MRHFTCFLPGSVQFGSGVVAGLAALVAGKTVLLLTDPGIRASGLVDRVREACTGAACVRLFDAIPAEPTEQQVEEVVAALDALLDSDSDDTVMLAVGGGSVMDMAKFAAVMVQGGPRMADLFAGRIPTHRKARLIMIPTTAGTGSEATPNAIALRPALQLKVGVVCPAFLPDKVLLDPDLTLKLPAPITAATGLDALCHALECYVSNKANPLSDMFAVEAIRLIFTHLRTACADGGNVEARGGMLLASFYAGVCIASAGTTAVHALSYPLGGRYRIPHGVSNAMLLAPVFRHNRDACADKLAGLASLLPEGSAEGDRLARADRVVAELAALARDLGIPATLAELGIPEDDLDELVLAASEVKRLLDNNPKPLSRDDIRSIYLSILK